MPLAIPFKLLCLQSTYCSSFTKIKYLFVAFGLLLSVTTKKRKGNEKCGRPTGWEMCRIKAKETRSSFFWTLDMEAKFHFLSF